MPTAPLTHEQMYWQQGKMFVAGVDEVGRGPVAGPVVAAAVEFARDHTPIQGVTDSKKISAKKRAALEETIRAQAMAVGIGEISAAQIDTHGIVWATEQAMLQAVHQLEQVHVALVDGKPVGTLSNLLPCPAQFIVKGDTASYSIAAASIVAKVYRDALMQIYAVQYPHYAWQQNNGYGTKAHLDAIQEHGLTTYHRRSFLNSYL